MECNFNFLLLDLHMAQRFFEKVTNTFFERLLIFERRSNRLIKRKNIVIILLFNVFCEHTIVGFIFNTLKRN
jgi:hypothetical protein